MQTFDEREVHIYNGADPSDDSRTHIRFYGDMSDCWVVDCYNPKFAERMEEKGFKPERGSTVEQATFMLTAKQLIEFIAAEAGINLLFRKRKRRTLTEEQRKKYREMIAEARKAG